MPLIEEKFDQHKIDSLKRYLQRETDKGRPKDYEIIVDGFKVVSRTDTIEEFDDYEQEIKDDSRNVSILIYDGPGTNRNTRYSFSFQHAGLNVKANSVSNGLGEIDLVIAQKLEEKEREHETTRLKESLQATKAQLAEAEDYADSLEKRIKEMEASRYTQAVSLGEVASVLLKTLVKQHAAKIPGGHALAGLLGADLTDEQSTALPAEVAPSVSFEKQADIPTPLDEQTRNRLSLIEQMQQRFNEQEMVAVFSIMDAMAATPERIEGVLAFLGLQTKTAIA